MSSYRGPAARGLCFPVTAAGVRLWRGDWWPSMRDPRWQKTAIVASVLLLAVVHAQIAGSNRLLHNLLFHFNFLPITAAGMLFGGRGAAVVTLLTFAAELPSFVIKWPYDTAYQLDQAGGTLLFGVAGVILGRLRERERRQRAKLEQTKSELERVYGELRENVEKLGKAERMFAVAQLSASLAHEIRNPLASISGAAGILKRGHASRENVQDCVEIIDRESQRLNKLLTNFLSFARPRAPRFQPTPVPEVIDSVIALASHSPGASGIRFEREIEDNMPEIESDPEQLKQVLLNLVINAIQATGEGVVRLRALARNDRAVIAVEDEGSGLSPEARERLFDPFFTTKENGTGLGLAIASKIVEQHGGVLRADAAAAGRGLTVTVELPRKQARAAAV